MLTDDLRAELQRRKVVERAAGAKMFMGVPDRWYEQPKWRCENDHVSINFLKSEAFGSGFVSRL